MDAAAILRNRPVQVAAIGMRVDSVAMTIFAALRTGDFSIDGVPDLYGIGPRREHGAG